MATTIDPNTLQAYGYSQQDGQALAQSLGITTDQLVAAFKATPLTGGSAPSTTSYGMTTGGNPPGRDLDATINQLQIAKAAGMGGSSSQAPASAGPGGATSGGNADVANLGAYGLAAVGLNPSMTMTLNPTPGQGMGSNASNFAKTGVSPVAQPTSYKLPSQIPQTSVPSVFNAAPTPTAPGANAQVAPTAQPAAQQAPNVPIAQPPSTKIPSAQPPAAPGLMGAIPPMPAGWGVVTDKSQIFRPSSAGPPLNAGGGASTVKLATGGPVTGPAGRDRVPAMLTSGEYVMNKDAVKDIGVSQLDAMNRRHYQDGGYVDDDDPYALHDNTMAPTGKVTEDPTGPFANEGTVLPPVTTTGRSPSGAAPSQTPRPYTYGAPPPYAYGGPPQQNWFQRAGQTIGHFFTGQLGQGNQAPAAPGSSFTAPGDSRNWTPEMARAFRNAPANQPPYTYGAPPANQPYTYGAPPPAPKPSGPADPDPDWLYAPTAGETGGAAATGAGAAGAATGAAKAGTTAATNPYSQLGSSLAQSAADLAKAFSSQGGTPYHYIAPAFNTGSNTAAQRNYNTTLLNNARFT